MNATNALLLFVTSIAVLTFLVFTFVPKLAEQASSTATTSDIVYKKVSNALRVLSAYTDGTYTYFLVTGFSGSIPLPKVKLLVDRTPLDVNVVWVKDLGDRNYLNPGDIAYVVVQGVYLGEHTLSFVSQTTDFYAGEVSIERAYWKYRRKITVLERSGTALTDYQVRVEFNTDNFDFTHVQPDCSDLRFTDENGEKLSFWIQECSPNRIIVWVKVPSIPANGETNIYVYYGTNGVLSASNGPETFIFFDDFEQWDGWVQYGSGVVEQSAEQHFDGRFSLKKDLYGDPNGGYKAIPVTVNYGVALEAHVMRTYLSGANADRIGIIDGSGNGYGVIVFHGTSPYIGIDRRSSYTATVLTSTTLSPDVTNAWYRMVFIWEANGTLIGEAYDASGSLLGRVVTTDTTYSTFSNVYVFGGYTYFVDQLFLRKYVAPEPLAIVGSEESGTFSP